MALAVICAQKQACRAYKSVFKKLMLFIGSLRQQLPRLKRRAQVTLAATYGSNIVFEL